MKLIIYILMIFLFSIIGKANNIKYYEYWFNSEYINRTKVEFDQPKISFSIDFELDVSGLSPGINNLYIRYLDSNNKWSPVVSKRFLLPMPSKSGLDINDNKLVEYEYWFENDYKNKKRELLNAVQSFNLTEIINLSSFAAGIHNIRFRFKDSIGEWSPVVNKRFIMPIKSKNDLMMEDNKLVEYEYWFDNKYGEKIKKYESASNTYEIINYIDLPNLRIGNHYFHFRTKDSLGNYSIVRSHGFFIPGDTNIILLKSGWNLISSYIKPQEPDSINNVLNDISTNLVIAKNNAGQVFIPSYDINTIGLWEISQGYLLYMNQSDSLLVIGKAVNPSENPIELKSGWNTISFLRDSELNAVDAFTSITDDNNLLIAKTLEGLVYIPSYQINSIGNLKPGVGYRVYVTTSDSLVFPNNE